MLQGLGVHVRSFEMGAVSLPPTSVRWLCSNLNPYGKRALSATAAVSSLSAAVWLALDLRSSPWARAGGFSLCANNYSEYGQDRTERFVRVFLVTVT